MLSKTMWSWELRTWLNKMNLLDILSTSPHYFSRKWIGATNESSNVDLRFKGLKNVANRVNVKKSWLAKRVTRQATGSPFCEGRFTLLANPKFLLTNTLTRPAGSTQSRRNSQSMCEHCWLGQRGQLFFPLTQLEDDPLFRDNFSSYERDLTG